MTTLHPNQEKQKARSVVAPKANDIKCPNLNIITEDAIAATPVEKVYEWVKTGAWNQKDFKRWLKVIRVIE